MVKKFYYNGVIKLLVNDKFIYNVTLYKLWKNRAECIGDKNYASENLLKIKECTCKAVDDFKLVKFITLIAAPLSYLTNNNFKLTNNEEIRLKRKSSTRRNK